MKKQVIVFLCLMMTSLYSTAQRIIELTPEEKQAFVKAHNLLRQKVGSPQVQWSEELENYAKGWALMLAKTKKFQHSPQNKYGENLYKSTFKPSPIDVVATWAEEQKYYHGEKITLDNYWIFGHYTQIIWAKTTQIGCAMAQDNAGIYYVVCEYYPPGNIINQKPIGK